MVDRIKKVMEYKNLTPALFAEQLEISRSNLTHLFTGRNQPSLLLAKKILETYPDINTEWLIMGVGKMVNSELPKTAEDSVKIAVPASVPEVSEPDLFSALELSEKVETTTPQTPPALFDELPTTNSEELDEPVKDNSPIMADTMVMEPQPRKRATTKRAHIAEGGQGRTQIFDSRGDKKVKKIVFFYTDKSFEEFFPDIN